MFFKSRKALLFLNEFSPQAPTNNVEDRKKVTTTPHLESMQIKLTKAEGVYKKALGDADTIDTQNKTEIPYHSNAVRAAELLSSATVRGADNA